MRRRLTVWGLGTVALAACTPDFDTTRAPPPRGTLGEEMYGVMCDRVGAQALHEDLTGASFRAVCHKQADGTFADTVDQTLLPEATADAVDAKGNSVSVAQQQAGRAAAVARVQALARRRADLIRAFDATFPDVKVPVKDVKNTDGKKSCGVPEKSGEARLHDELTDMLGRFQQLYNDGTIPQSTEALAKIMKAFQANGDAQTALARFDSRQGYRPVEVALGAARPVIAYPNLRDLSNATLRLLSADSDPYAPDPPRDASGNRVPVPGAANAQFNKALEAMHQELLAAKANPVLPPLAITADATGRDVLSRPRDNLELVSTLLYAQDPAFGSGDSRYIVKRDGRGYALVSLVNGAVPAPFVDADHDLLADVDDLGRFVSSDGQPPPTPFFTVTSTASATRDAFGRALLAQNGQPMYETIDTSHTFGASMLADLKPLVNPDASQSHETLMYAVAGAQVVFGARDGSPATTKNYDSGGSIAYDAFHPESAPMLDLVYALGQVLADRNTDDVLAYTKQLFKTQTPLIARLTGDALAARASAQNHPEAQIPVKSPLWDDLLDVFVKVAKEPGLLEDVLRALGQDDSLQLGTMFSNYMKVKDRITYDPSNLNGPPLNLETNDASQLVTPVDRNQPDTGWNRSAMQRFLGLIHDADGVTACNKEGAVVHAKGVPIAGSIDMPLFGTYKECEVFKIENLARFYLDSIVGKANIYFRPSILRNGVAGIGAASVDTIEQSSGIGLNANDTHGFWDPPSAETFHPRPQWLNRLVFFDLAHDSPNPGDLNYTTNHFLGDLQGNIGTIVCPERIIDDPDPSAIDASPDGKVHGLRACRDGDWLAQRQVNTIFTWEDFGFYKTMTPLLNAFVNHHDASGKLAPREDLLLELIQALNEHWATDKGTASECDQGNGQTCGKDGLVTYEELNAEIMASDLLPALHDLVNVLDATTIKRCTAVDPKTGACTKTADVDGIAVIASATRAMVDPTYAESIGLKDRAGNATATRNDGSTNPQVTPVYLLTGALSAVDQAFADYAQKSPDGKDRLAQWRTARSQLVDQFLSVQGNGGSPSFVDPAVPKIVPVLVDALRAQMLAHCPTSYTPPYDACDWAKTELTQKISDVVGGPLFATAMDLGDAIRKDDGARTQLEALVTYLLDAASQNEALASVLASTADQLQVLRDDTNLVPLYHVLAEATAASTTDANGVTTKSLVDASTALLAKISGRAYDTDGTELCNKELDPNQILAVALANLVTPMQTSDGQQGQTPLEVIMDVIGDVNRLEPDHTDKLVAADYANISDNVVDFLLNKERGLEQFYEIVRQGTVR